MLSINELLTDDLYARKENIELRNSGLNMIRILLRSLATLTVPVKKNEGSPKGPTKLKALNLKQ